MSDQTGRVCLDEKMYSGDSDSEDDIDNGSVAWEAVASCTHLKKSTEMSQYLHFA